jgi:hypothetical protein
VPSDEQDRSRRSPRALVAPLLGYFDHRFDDVHQRLARLEQGLDDVRAELAALRRSAELDAETVIELHHATERALHRLADALEGGAADAG